MRVNDDYPTWNANREQNDPDSVLNFWKKALSLRKEYEVLVCAIVMVRPISSTLIFNHHPDLRRLRTTCTVSRTTVRVQEIFGGYHRSGSHELWCNTNLAGGPRGHLGHSWPSTGPYKLQRSTRLAWLSGCASRVRRMRIYLGPKELDEDACSIWRFISSCLDSPGIPNMHEKLPGESLDQVV